MAVLDVQPLVLKDIELILGGPTGDDFRKHASGVTFTPSSSSITWTGLGQNSHTDVATATWAASIDYVQDWDSANSLSRYLYEHEGETVPATFRPRSGVGPSFEVDLVITPGAIGGQVNSFATTTVTLGCAAKPELVPAA